MEEEGRADPEEGVWAYTSYRQLQFPNTSTSARMADVSGTGSLKDAAGELTICRSSRIKAFRA
jgi:hypothetical protein